MRVDVSYSTCRVEWSPLNPDFPIYFHPNNSRVGLRSFARAGPWYDWMVPFFSTDFEHFPKSVDE